MQVSSATRLGLGRRSPQERGSKAWSFFIAAFKGCLRLLLKVADGCF